MPLPPAATTAAATVPAAAHSVVEALEARTMLAVTPARPADAFVDSIGVNTHFGYRDTLGQPYADVPTTKSLLSELGVRHVRDGTDVYSASAKLWIQDTYRNLFLDTGIKTTFIPTTSSQNTPAAMLSAINRITPAALDGIEGYNEPDNLAIGGSGNQAAIDWQNAFYAAIKGSADPAVYNLPVSGPSPIFGYGAFAGLGASMDYHNAHPYPGPEMPNRSLDANMTEADKVAGTGPEKPFIFTEWGYDHAGDNKVSYRAAGLYAPRFFAEAFNRGVRLSHYYQLWQQGEVAHNLAGATMSADGRTVTGINRRPAFHALKGMIATLAEPGASFQPGSLDYTLAGPTGKAEFYGGANVRQTLLQKSNGDFYLMLWNEVTSYNSAADTDVVNAPVPVTLKVNQALGAATVYQFGDDGLMTTTTPSYANGEIALNVSDRVTIVRLDPTSASVFAQTGNISLERWVNAPGTAVADVPAIATPAAMERVFALEGYNNVGDDLGQRVRGHLVAPESGPYRFWVAGDDSAAFHLSRSANPADKQLLASAPTATLAREWGKFAEQRSHVVYLEAGERYYFELLHKEGTGNDHVAVGWARPATAVKAIVPDEVVPGSVLASYGPYSFTDDLADTLKLHARTGPWATTTLADGNKNTVDGHVVYKTDDAQPAELVWRADDLETFYAYAYDLTNSAYSQPAHLQFLASPDGVSWTPVATRSHRVGETSGQVFNTSIVRYELTPQGPLPGNTNFLKYRVNAGAGSAGGFRLGWVRLTAGSQRGADAPLKQDAGADNLVSVEAEQFQSRVGRGGKDWTLRTPAGASGSGVMVVPGTGGLTDTGYASAAPRLDYKVKFATAGTYYVWVRGSGAGVNDDSVHVGLNGGPNTTADRMTGVGTSLSWARATSDGPVATVTVPSAGVHTLNLWMREDGMSVDKLVLTTNAAYAPGGTGPAVSPRTATLGPAADAFVKGGTAASSNFGGNAGLEVKDDPADPSFDREGYVKFSAADLFATGVTSASLRFTATGTANLSAASPVVVRLYAVTDDAWAEQRLTWNARPARGTLVGTATVSAAGDVISFDVTAVVNAQLAAGDTAFSFVLVADSPGPKLATFGSRESLSPVELALTY